MPAFHFGRLLDHVHLHARDFAATRRFYEAIFSAMGLTIPHRGDTWFQMDELYVDGDTSMPASHIHLAFQAADRAMVEAMYVRASPPVGATTARRASASITSAITLPSSSIRTATISRRCSTAPIAAPPPPSKSIR